MSSAFNLSHQHKGDWAREERYSSDKYLKKSILNECLLQGTGKVGIKTYPLTAFPSFSTTNSSMYVHMSGKQDLMHLWTMRDCHKGVEQHIFNARRGL